MDTLIVVPWENQKLTWWNETCAQIMEHFGLPGDRYTTEVSENDMKFFFKNKHDALLCRIMISENI